MNAAALLSEAKATADADKWERTRLAAPGVWSDGTSGRRREERMRSPGVGDVGREGRYKASAEVAARSPEGKSEEAIVARKAGITNRRSEGPLLEPALLKGEGPA